MPDHIFGHQSIVDRCEYVRARREGEDGYLFDKNPKNCLCVAAVEYDSVDTGHVVTSHYTDKLSRTINVNDVRYKNKNNLR